jgi:predicted DNA-binding protein (UPF0251 family)
MKKIKFILSDNLFNKLNQIKNELIIKEKYEISFSDMIEESLMSYYNINISDININNENFCNPIIVNTINDLKNINNYYVYAYYNMRKKIDKKFDNIIFLYEPIYVGKGKDNRIYDINGREKLLVEFINELRLTNDFCMHKLYENLDEFSAYNYEQMLISFFGRLNNGTGSLYNKSGDFKIKKKIKNDTISELNLEYQQIESILKTLNNNKNITNAAKKLNISERTLYRKIEKYKIKKNKQLKIWFI